MSEVSSGPRPRFTLSSRPSRLPTGAQCEVPGGIHPVTPPIMIQMTLSRATIGVSVAAPASPRYPQGKLLPCNRPLLEQDPHPAILDPQLHLSSSLVLTCSTRSPTMTHLSTHLTVMSPSLPTCLVTTAASSTALLWAPMLT